MIEGATLVDCLVRAAGLDRLKLQAATELREDLHRRVDS
ncbi:hypothetical protein ABAC460_17095 [Asticcacaulis sp. AC460]|nr:hypothetical protein ABAC460_17095 [Asticcacaulis sp. AC460]